MPSIATLTRVNTRYFQSRSAQVQVAAVAWRPVRVAIEQAKIGGQRTTINRWFVGTSGSSEIRSNPDSGMLRLARELSSAAP